VTIASGRGEGLGGTAWWLRGEAGRRALSPQERGEGLGSGNDKPLRTDRRGREILPRIAAYLHFARAGDGP
jgi:hypothetical protein